jgi:two-component system phosphate regulon response regulator PhoB
MNEAFLRAVARIVVLDPDASTWAAIAAALSDAGYDVDPRRPLEDAMADARAMPPDLIVCDFVHLDREASAFVRELARAGPRILFLSAVADPEARVRAFEAGADDFVMKPFSVREVVLRARALVRRRGPQSSPAIINVGPLRIDAGSLHAWVAGESVNFSKREIDVLVFLAHNANRAVTRDMLIANLWADNDERTSARMVDTTIRRLRAKLGRARDLVRTVRGVGYQLRANEAQREAG